MRVLLIRPPRIMGGLEKSSIQHPVNLAWLAAVLLANGIEARILDFEVERLGPEEFLDRVSVFSPDLVGFTCLSATVVGANRLACLVKENFPETLVVAGGPHISAMPARSLEEFAGFDVAVFGEGEQTLLELCQRVSAGDKGRLGGIRGLAYRESSQIIVQEPRPLIENLDTIPHPARHLLPLELYRGASTPGLAGSLQNSTVLFTSRGCSEDCTFCASKITFSRRLRFRSAEHVLSEVRECVKDYGFGHFTIDDDTFTLNRRRLREILEGFGSLGISWDCDTRVNAVDEETLRMMKSAGCKKVAFGIESGSERIRRLIKKRITRQEVVSAFEAARRVGLVTQAFFIIGSHPSETLAEVRMTLDLAREIRPDFIVVNIVTPFPGTELYRIMKSGGYIEAEDWEKFDCTHTFPCWHTDNFSADQLVRLQRWFYLRYALSLRYLLSILKRIKSLAGLRYYLSTAAGFSRYLLFERRH